MSVLNVSKNNFDQIKNSEKAVLLDFYADWCAPCQMILPVISEIAEEYAGSLKVVRINVDDEPELTGSFGISSIPALMYIKKGQLIGSHIGYISKTELENKIKEWK